MNRAVSDKVQSIVNFRRALKFVWESTPAWTTVSVFLSLIQGVLPLASLYLYKLLIDAVTLDIRLHGDYSATHRVVALLICVAGVSVASSVLRSLSTVSGDVQSQEVSDKMQTALHKQSVNIDLGYYENSKFYDTLHRAQAEAPFRSNRIVSNLTQLTLSAITLGAIGTLVLVTIHWQLALLLVGLSIPGIIVKVMFADRLYVWQRRNTVVERLVSYYNWLLTSDASAKELRLFNLGSLFIDRSAVHRSTLRNGRTKITRDRAVADGITDAGATIAVYVTFGVIAIAAVNGRTSIGTLVVFFQAIQRGQTALQDLLSGVADLYENNLFLNNLYEFLEMKPTIADPATPASFPKQIKHAIKFSNVSFKYAGAETPVLDGINLEIKAGETIALVGENGAGKTTLIKLLCRLYEPTEGSISVDGVSLGSFTCADLRRQIAVVFQDYIRYSMTARENIWFGNVDMPPDNNNIEAAAVKSGADRVVNNLPNGYDTLLGYIFDGGKELSTGQWQKIALARAFYREAQILLLDEPTSSLDAQAEFEVFQAFRALTQGKTAILVSHRLSTVRMADRILVLDRGRIVEQGTHEELIELAGAYARVFETQVNSYIGNHRTTN